MLKTFRGLALGLVVLVGSAYVTPTYASSTSVVIVSVQPGAPSRAYEEHILLYNPTPSSVDITDWCLTNKSNKQFACFGVSSPDEAFIIEPYSYGLVVSEYKASLAYDNSQYSFVYYGSSLNTSSITASSDTVSLIDHNEEVVDAVSWSKSIASSHVLNRIELEGHDNDTYLDTDSEDDWVAVASTAFMLPVLNMEVHKLPGRSDVCMNIKGYQQYPPEGQQSIDGICVDSEELAGEDVEVPYIRINEILPNPAGADAGKEYIELYNFGDQPQNLSRYKLLIGKSLEKTLELPDINIAPGGYFVIKNSVYNFSLLNTANSVALSYGSRVVHETSYLNPKDDMSWSFIDDSWVYTNQQTPGEHNKPSLLTVKAANKSAPSNLKPCASNQYRHPETNRCRLLSSAISKSSQKPCASNQFRNPETGRCKLISSASEGPKPCKEGQERNPETNRCRNIKKMTNVDYGVLGAETQTSPEEVFHMWMLGALAAIGVIAYAVWEWRQEIKRLFYKVREKFARQHK